MAVFISDSATSSAYAMEIILTSTAIKNFSVMKLMFCDEREWWMSYYYCMTYDAGWNIA